MVLRVTIEQFPANGLCALSGKWRAAAQEQIDVATIGRHAHPQLLRGTIDIDVVIGDVGLSGQQQWRSSAGLKSGVGDGSVERSQAEQQQARNPQYSAQGSAPADLAR